MIPTISREEAARLLSSPRNSLAARVGLTRATLQRAELLFLPFYSFEIELAGEANARSVRVAVDGLGGEVVFFIAAELERRPLVDEQACDFEVSAGDAMQVALDHYRRTLLEHGLRNKRSTAVDTVSATENLLFPFWIGYLRKVDVFDFRAVDAVSGDMQGIRMRKVILKAFRQLERG